MKKRTLGNTGIWVSPLCYGCAAAYARDLISDQTAIELFQEAYKAGITTFDTGHSYGKAETRIGLAIQSGGIDRKKLVISTKCGTRVVDGKYIHDVSLEWLKRSIDTSLSRMKTDYIDILYIHGPSDEDLVNDSLLNFLGDYKTQGIICATGANTFDNQKIDFISDNHCFDVVMLDYNIIKQERESQILKLTQEGIGVVAGQAMGEGLFLPDLYKIKEKKDLWYLARTFGRKESRELYLKARKFRFLNNISKYDASIIALKYVLDNRNVSTASFGTCSFEHLHKNIQSIDIEIPNEVLERIKNTL